VSKSFNQTSTALIEVTVVATSGLQMSELIKSAETQSSPPERAATMPPEYAEEPRIAISSYGTADSLGLKEPESTGVLPPMMEDFPAEFTDKKAAGEGKKPERTSTLSPVAEELVVEVADKGKWPDSINRKTAVRAVQIVDLPAAIEKHFPDAEDVLLASPLVFGKDPGRLGPLHLLTC